MGGNAIVDERILRGLIEERGNHPQKRQLEVPADFDGILESAVDVLEEERQTDSEAASAEECDEQVVARVRPGGSTRHFGCVDDADITRLEVTGNAGFLRALHEAFEDLAVARSIARQHAVLNALAIERKRASFLLFECLCQAAFLRQCLLVIVSHRLNNLGNLSLDLRLG